MVKSASVAGPFSPLRPADAFECSPAEIDPSTGKCPVPKNDVDQPHVSLAPLIRIFDNRGCKRPRTEYTGKPSGDANDEMLVMVCVLCAY